METSALAQLPPEIWLSCVLPHLAPVRPAVSEDIQLALPRGMSPLLQGAFRALFVGESHEVRALLALRATCRTLRDWVDAEYGWLWAGVWLAAIGPDEEWRGQRRLRELDCAQLAQFAQLDRVRTQCAAAAAALRAPAPSSWAAVARHAVRAARVYDYRRACEALVAAPRKRARTATGEVEGRSAARRRARRRAEQRWLQAGARLAQAVT